MPFKVIPFLKLCEFSGVNSTFGEGKHYTISCLTVFQCDFQHLRMFIWSQSMTHLVTTPPPRGKKSNLGRNPVTFAVENSAQKPRGNGEIKQKARKRERETFALRRDVFSFIEISIRFSIHKKLQQKKMGSTICCDLDQTKCSTPQSTRSANSSRCSVCQSPQCAANWCIAATWAEISWCLVIKCMLPSGKLT